mmetsp:Transcript_45933/g.85681  ORF Transcript_45933/g.85681 Transcript_45933/m.85681 type:complete len:175 (+) Transcript_45933:94-618(+)
MARLATLACWLQVKADGPLVPGQKDCTGCRFTILEGYCEPNYISAGLCSATAETGPAHPETCSPSYAGEVPVGGDWSRETGFAYFHPDSCDEACAESACLLDTNCAGFTVATFPFDETRTVALKSRISHSTPWSGYECKQKVCGCDADAMASAQSFRRVSLLGLLVLLTLLMQG